ncbi:MAG: twin-arginine translocase TatA/TatE family subunit [Methanosarcinales archaeon]
MPGPTELMLIFFIIVLLFGATKLPELARSMGKSMGEFKKAQKESDISLKDLEVTNESQSKSKIQQTAQNLGISIEGMTDDQLIEEIEKATKQ